jgi:hypothetical protein
MPITMCLLLSPGDWFQLGSVIVAAVGLYFLVKYVGYTRAISQEATRQTETAFKPAIIAIHGATTDAHGKLRNVGNGPAMDVEWQITNTKHRGRFSCIEAGSYSEEMKPSNLKALTNGALQSPNQNEVAITCSYKSISGKEYASVSKHALESGRFDTTFRE